MSADITLVTTVGEAERPLAIAAAYQVSAAVSGALGRNWPVDLVLSDIEGRTGAGSIWIASLIDDVPRDEPIAVTTRRWRDRIVRWREQERARILLATLFRGAPVRADGIIVERLRRLNMMALSLSCDTGIEIVDIDRLFAWCGARTLRTDYRCLGERAAAIGGHAIAAAILAGDLGDILPADVQEQAAGHHGGTQNIADILNRRISTP